MVTKRGTKESNTGWAIAKTNAAAVEHNEKMVWTAGGFRLDGIQ